MLKAVHEGTKVANSILPAIAILLPLLGGLAVAAVGDRNERVRDYLAITSSVAAFAACVAMFPRVMLDGVNLTTNLHVLFDFRLTVDPLGLIFALLASLVWMLSNIYARNYIQHEERRTRYHVFNLFTEAATLGVFLAADFFVLFVFFELMGFLAYMLVIHSQTYDARKAGVKYIFMTVYGGLSLLMGVLLFFYYAGGLGFAAHEGSAYLTTSICFVVAGFMIGGFGVKAGMVPLHVWLPLAHPAAPSPASALLSGVMIKAGAYGFLRVVGTLQVAPAAHGKAALIASHSEGVEKAAEHAAPIAMQNLHSLGWVIIWLAMLTMVVGMILALVQDNVKRLLAYSSISQMGYILMGIGIGAYLGDHGAMGLAGGIYHIMNHGLFKSLLFLGVGAVYFATHQLDMTKLGGLWRKMPVTTALTCIGALGIMGIPLFNGFASKTLLHHAVVETLSVGGPWMRAVDIIFMVAAGGTICYIAKLISLTFFGHHRGDKTHEIKEVPWAMRIGMGGLAAGVILFGIFPGWVISKLVIPALNLFIGLDPHAVEHLGELSVFTIKDFLAILPPLAIGAGIFLVATRWNLFRVKLPEAAGIDYYYSRAEIGFLRTCFAGSNRYAELRAKYWPLARSTGEYFYEMWKFMRNEYHRVRLAVLDRFQTLPMDIEGLAAYVRARQFTGDIAYGVIVIAAILALLVFTLL